MRTNLAARQFRSSNRRFAGVIRRNAAALGASVLVGAGLGACAAAPAPAVPDGSGCTPPAGSATLPDGYWAVIVSSGTSTSISYDLICWFVGDQANLAATEDGSSEVPVPNDHYTRNNNPLIRKQAYAAGAEIIDLRSIPSTFERITPSQVNSRLAGDLAWLTIANGKVRKVEQQYIP